MKTSELTAEEITRLLDLEANATCGFVRVTYVAKQEIAPGGLPHPFAGGGPIGIGIILPCNTGSARATSPHPLFSFQYTFPALDKTASINH